MLSSIALLAFAGGCLQLLAAKQEQAEKKPGPRIDVSADSDENVKGADVWLDNEVKGRAPLVLQTTSGRHLVELKKSGFDTFSQWVTIKTDQETMILVPRLAGGGGPPGASSAPGASVAVVVTPPNTWKYDVTSTDAAPFRRVVWEGGTKAFDGKPAFFIDSVVVSRSGAARMHEREFFVRGPDGLEHLGTQSDFESTDTGSHTHSITDTNLASPQLTLPMPFQVSAKWSVKNSMQVVTKTVVVTTATKREDRDACLKRRSERLREAQKLADPTIRARVLHSIPVCDDQEPTSVSPPETLTKTSDSSARSTTTITGEYAVTGIEQVTVAAGTFDCLVVRGTATTRTEHDEGSRTGTVENVTTVTVAWYAPKVGLVKSDASSDLEVRAKGATTTKRWTSKTQLKEYQVVGSSLEMEALGFVSALPKPVAPPPIALPAPPSPIEPPPVH